MISNCRNQVLWTLFKLQKPSGRKTGFFITFLCTNKRMATIYGRILYLLCFCRCIWIVYTECGYYNEIPTDICSYVFVEYESSQSSSFSCKLKYDDANNSDYWIIEQNIFDGSTCSGEAIQQIEYECSPKDCHCSKTSSGYQCDAAIVRTQDFDFERIKCDPRSYTESLIVVNQCINDYKQYQCQDSKLILQPCNSTKLQHIESKNDNDNLKRPSLLNPSPDDEYDNCVDIKCMTESYSLQHGNNEQKIDSRDACLPVNVCQNSKYNLHGNTSWKYNCDQYGIINKFVYNSHDCIGYQLDDIYNVDMFKYQKDIIECNNECKQYLKIKEYDVNDINGCNEEIKDEYNYNEFIFGLGCHSFWINDNTQHSIKRDCTNSSYSVTKYDNGNCDGLPYGEYLVNDGCSFVDIKLYNNSFSYLSFIEIIECGLDQNQDDNDNVYSLTNKINEIFFIIFCIYFVLFL